MLTRMHITDLGVIDDATLDLSPGLNVLTGETGAGKTMVVSGLGLLLGARADTALVRSGSNGAVVEGLVDVAVDHPARQRVRDAGGDADDEVILVRSVSAQGRSRAHVGGRQAPVAVLADLGETLVAVHGQADQWRLKRPEAHRDLLDDFAGDTVAQARADYDAAYTRCRELRAELDRVAALERDRLMEADVLRARLEELEHVDPRPGEEAQLRAEDERLAHADALRGAAGRGATLLLGGDEADGAAGDGVTQLLGAARAELAHAAEHDEALSALEQRVAELAYLASDLGAELAAYATEVDLDPARLDWVQQRRAQLARLSRAHGADIEQILAWGATAAARLNDLEGAAQRADELAEQLQTEVAELGRAAAALSEHRSHAAKRLGERVTGELAHLAMGRATVVVAVEHHPAPDGDGLVVPGHETPLRFGASGIDDVEIRLAANPGTPGRSVARAASGGELSRVMLAIEVVGADLPARAAGESDGVGTFVFDEVDAGVGGRAALDIGARLAALARHAQVIVVTHLAQVAAFADRHLVVDKTGDGHITASSVRAVDGQDRLAELARMMAGTDTGTALQHAAELLEQAQARRATP